MITIRIALLLFKPLFFCCEGYMILYIVALFKYIYILEATYSMLPLFFLYSAWPEMFFVLDEHATEMSSKSGFGYLTAAYRIQVQWFVFRLFQYVLSVCPSCYCILPSLFSNLFCLSLFFVYQNVVRSSSRWLQEQQYQQWQLRSLKLQPLTPVPRYRAVVDRNIQQSESVIDYEELS